jgi:tryptophan-rich sensory protein
MNRSPRPAIGIAGWVLLSFAAAAVGAVASANAADFYAQLSKPSWAPPAYLFGPVWSVLYFLMGLAAGLVWRARGFSGAPTALALFIVQLIVNGLWTWTFFAWRDGALAFVTIVVLLLMILATLLTFARIRPLAAALLVPYLLWVGYATALTYTVWQLNPRILA